MIRGRPKNPERIYYDELFEALDIPYIQRGDITYFMNPVTGRNNTVNLENLRRAVEQLISNGVMDEGIRYEEKNNDTEDEVEGVEEKIESKNSSDNPTFSSIRSLLKENKGSMVRLVLYRDGDIILDKTYRVPLLGFGGFWHELTTFDLMVDSNKSIIPNGYYDGDYLNHTFTMESFIIQEVKNGNPVVQNFNDGIKHCILYPIKNWAKGCFESSKSATSKKRYTKILSDIDGLIVEYKEGVPEAHIQKICELLQIDIKVDLPLDINEPFIYCKSSKKRLKLFEFINTRLDHVDLNEVVLKEHIKNITRDEMYELKNELDSKDEYYIYQKDMRGISSLTTFNGRYTINSEYHNTVCDFEESVGFDYCKLDDVLDSQLSTFIKYGTHYNATVDFKDIYPFTKNVDVVKHIDMEQAYANFHKCKWYEGFLGKITDFRKTDKIVAVGLYLVEEFHFKSSKCKKYNDIMRMYQKNNVYGSPELKMLSSLGVTYKIKAGCWGVKPFDFSFNDDMRTKKDSDGIRYYARWTGGCDQHKLEKSFYMKGDYELFQNIRNYVSNGTVRWVGVDEGCISYTKEHNHHLGHITSFITMYQRISVIEQLLEMDITKIIRVCVDGIYYTEHSFKLCNVFRYKKDCHFGNEPSDRYISNINDTIEMEFADKREHYAKELHIGAGGTGKTHKALTDKGLIRVLYVAPSRKLVRKKNVDYSITCDVLTNLIVNDVEKYDKIARYFNVLVLDEVSMYSETSKEAIFKRFESHKLIFCGDIGFQLPTWEGEPITSNGFDMVLNHTENYRIKCDELNKLCDLLRTLIRTGIMKNCIETDSYRSIINTKVEKFFIDRNRMIDIDELKELYDIKDYILVGTKDVGMEYTNMFKGKFSEEKYYVMKNTSEYSNGDIVYSKEKPTESNIEIRHHYTTHSIQGETIESKIFIDCSNMFDSRMFYTAISRAVYLHQIYLVKKN